MSGNAGRSDDDIRADIAVRYMDDYRAKRSRARLVDDASSLLHRAVDAEAQSTRAREDRDSWRRTCERLGAELDEVRRVEGRHNELLAAELAAAQVKIAAIEFETEVFRLDVVADRSYPLAAFGHIERLRALAAASGVAPGPGQPGKSDGDGAGLTGHRGFESPSTPGIAPGNPNAWPTL